MGPQGKWVEVQIRSKRMNEIAEKGLAAHWKYKEGAADESRFDKWFQQIREVLNTQDNDSIDFLQDFKTSFLAEEIYVYTPKGDVKMLPVGSTALDFAFKQMGVDEEVWLRALETPPERISYFSTGELTALKLVTKLTK